jgi:hypothetical protein
VRQRIIATFELLRALFYIGFLIWLCAHALRFFLPGFPRSIVRITNSMFTSIIDDPWFLGWLGLSFVVVTITIWIMLPLYATPESDHVRRGRTLGDPADLRHRLKSRLDQSRPRSFWDWLFSGNDGSSRTRHRRGRRLESRRGAPAPIDRIRRPPTTKRSA